MSLHLLEGLPPAEHLASVERFKATAGTRHQMSAEQALKDIIPSAADQNIFRNSAILHVAYILSEEVEGFSKFRPLLPSFKDPNAITPHISERHFLPTLDQEQGSTRGNMVVLEHYFQKTLNLPAEVFERLMYFILGDRLTTARDCAAQDQRAVDRSDHRVDHLSSFAITSGLMHVCLNFIQNVSRNYWGTTNKADNSLLTLRDRLPNRADVNCRKFDFYAWLRFLDATLRSLVLAAALQKLHLPNTTGLAQLSLDHTTFIQTCTTIVDSCLMPSIGRLEADGVKVVKGATVSGHTVLLMHDLMSLREMRHAIKHGHPERIRRMLKYWTPMFYAGGGYNYANECMELLHNLEHDWPKDSAKVLLAGMLVNTTGQADGFLEADLDVEHLNGDIKAHAHGCNATPKLLEKTAPAIGNAHALVANIFRELGVDDLNQHHAKVKQHKDIQLLTEHFCSTHTFDFPNDKPSTNAVVDLYRTGLHRLGGPNGGHAKHLRRHKLRLRARHGTSSDTFPNAETLTSDNNDEDNQELLLACDREQPEVILRDENDDMDDLINEAGDTDMYG